MAEIIKQPKRKYKFSVARERAEVGELCNGLPGDNICYKIISSGKFSSLGFIEYIASRTTIRQMTVSTLRVGKKHLKVLDVLHKKR